VRARGAATSSEQSRSLRSAVGDDQAVQARRLARNFVCRAEPSRVVKSSCMPTANPLARVVETQS